MCQNYVIFPHKPILFLRVSFILRVCYVYYVRRDVLPPCYPSQLAGKKNRRDIDTLRINIARVGTRQSDNNIT